MKENQPNLIKCASWPLLSSQTFNNNSSTVTFFQCQEMFLIQNLHISSRISLINIPMTNDIFSIKILRFSRDCRKTLQFLELSWFKFNVYFNFGSIFTDSPAPPTKKKQRHRLWRHVERVPPPKPLNQPNHFMRELRWIESLSFDEINWFNGLFGCSDIQLSPWIITAKLLSWVYSAHGWWNLVASNVICV